MSTIGISVAPAATTRLRITRRGRRVLAAVVALPITVALAASIIGGGSALASRESGAPASSFATVTVNAGESLWTIAQRVAPRADPRDVVDAVVRLNALQGVTVVPGQELALPPEYAPAR
jgi:LysM repeat protein